MNKYVLRTSLVWIGVLAAFSAVWLFRSGHPTVVPFDNEGVGPLARGMAESVEDKPPAKVGAHASGSIRLSSEGMQSIGVTLGSVQRKQLNSTLRATGTVDIDEGSVSYVHVRFSGYLKRVFANATYAYVYKGEPLFTVYSPELVATEQDYLNALQDEARLSASKVDGVASAAKAMVAATEARLRQWDVNESQIRALQQSRAKLEDLTVSSPVSGYITERTALPNGFAEPTARLYTIADLSQVWVYAQVFQDDVARIKPGDKTRITVDAYPTRSFSGRIESILPQVDAATRTVRVRIVAANPKLLLKPGMFVNVDIDSDLGSPLVVPASAVLQSGFRSFVYVSRGDGQLQPTDITLGSRVGDEWIVIAGLKGGEQVVTSGNFLIDSESQLQAASSNFVPPPPGADGTASITPQTARSEAKIEFSTNPEPPHKGSNVLRVVLTGPGGQLVDGALVQVLFSMPAMPGMGMAAMNDEVTLRSIGRGLYENNVDLQSGGTWQVGVTANKGGMQTATKQLRVNAQGGM